MINKMELFKHLVSVITLLQGINAVRLPGRNLVESISINQNVDLNIFADFEENWYNQDYWFSFEYYWDDASNQHQHKYHERNQGYGDTYYTEDSYDELYQEYTLLEEYLDATTGQLYVQETTQQDDGSVDTSDYTMTWENDIWYLILDQDYDKINFISEDDDGIQGNGNDYDIYEDTYFYYENDMYYYTYTAARDYQYGNIYTTKDYYDLITQYTAWTEYYLDVTNGDKYMYQTTTESNGYSTNSYTQVTGEYDDMWYGVLINTLVEYPFLLADYYWTAYNDWYDGQYNQDVEYYYYVSSQDGNTYYKAEIYDRDSSSTLQYTSYTSFVYGIQSSSYTYIGSEYTQVTDINYEQYDDFWYSELDSDEQAVLDAISTLDDLLSLSAFNGFRTKIIAFGFALSYMITM